MNRAVVGVCLGLAAAWSTGCGSSSTPKPPPTFPVKGTVELDGKPLAKGEITFSVTGQPGHTFPIADGAFSGQANEGKNRVEIFSYKQGPPLSTDPEKKPTKVNTLPARFNSQSKLTADVTSGGPNDFKLNVAAR